jgi:hypothetical protein
MRLYFNPLSVAVHKSLLEYSLRYRRTAPSESSASRAQADHGEHHGNQEKTRAPEGEAGQAAAA